MSTSLYQKYRPQTFSQMVGQEHVRTTLMNEIKNGTVSHAYLFSGPRGVGKTTTARLLARAVNYPETVDEQHIADDAVGRDILDGRSMDVIEIDAASHTGVDNVRENIIESARITPVQLQRKVFIIDEVHMLSTSAFNALLKTLEEPPQHAMFILATTELHKVPSTIVSRCERFNFRSIGFESMLDRLRHLVEQEDRRVDEDVLKAIAKRSEGALRDAESLLGQVLSLEGDHISMEIAEIVLPYSDTLELVGLWQELVRKQTAPAIMRVNRLLNDGIDLVQFSKDLIEFMRKVLLYRVQESLSPLQYLDLSQQEMQQLTQMAQEVSAMQMTRMIGVIMRALEVSQTATIPQLPLELAIISITDGGGATASAVAPTPVAEAPVVANEAVEDDGEISYEPLTEDDETDASGDDTEKVEVDATAATAVPSSRTQSPALQPSVAQSQAVPPQKNAVDSAVNEPIVVTGSTVSLAQVQARWTEVLEEINKRNHALNVSLKVGQLVSVDNGLLMIGFEYEFYKDRLMDPTNAQIIEQVFEHLFQVKLRLEIVVGKEYSGTVSEHTNVEQPSQDEVANVWDLVAASNFRPQES